MVAGERCPERLGCSLCTAPQWQPLVDQWAFSDLLYKNIDISENRAYCGPCPAGCMEKTAGRGNIGQGNSQVAG